MLVFWRGAIHCRVECQAHKPSHAWQPNNEISGHRRGAALPRHVDSPKYGSGASETNESGQQTKWPTNREGFLRDCGGCHHRISVPEAYLANAVWLQVITHDAVRNAEVGCGVARETARIWARTAVKCRSGISGPSALLGVQRTRCAGSVAWVRALQRVTRRRRARGAKATPRVPLGGRNFLDVWFGSSQFPVPRGTWPVEITRCAPRCTSSTDPLPPPTANPPGAARPQADHLRPAR
jgi:hypothetical protein